MSTWLYQINQKSWTPQRFRIEIWEHQTWQWRIGQKIAKDHEIIPGDTVVFFYAKSGGAEAGFYGWAVIMEWLEETKELTFRPTAPTDHLKIDPWWNGEAEKLADAILGTVKQGTLWYVEDEFAKGLRIGIAAWLSGATKR